MNKQQSHAFDVALYCLTFLILWEWARPINELMNLNKGYVFIFFIAGTLLVSYLRVSMWLGIILKALAFFYCLHALFFYQDPLFSFDWIDYLFQELNQNFVFLFNRNYAGFTDLFRVFVFFILLWLMTYLMHHWLIQSRRFLLFLFITLVYLGILDTFTDYQATGAIVVVMVSGLLLMSCLKLARMQDERVQFVTNHFKKLWFMSMLCVLLLITLIGFKAPKSDPKWPDPVPYMSQLMQVNSSPLSVQHRIGYDEDDSRLGGSFRMDETPLFHAEVKGDRYWRIESKDRYTGKGWVNSTNRFTALQKPYDQFDTLKLYEKGATLAKQEVSIRFVSNNHNFLPYTDQLTDLSIQNRPMSINLESGKLATNNMNLVKGYKMDVIHPIFSVSKLKSVKDSSQDPADIRSKNTQLPRKLPNRVRDLAKKITAKATNRYDQANAIVNYLTSGRFEYRSDDIPFPKKNQDYVDQFLFQSKMGYCDNYSTSMVVMLRTIGVPARWVKGFSMGTYQGTSKQGKQIYEIRNADAHSWVEVYFPGSGWVPFEPTKSFSNVAEFKNDEITTNPSHSEASPKNNNNEQHEQPKQRQNGQNQQRTEIQKQQQQKNETSKETKRQHSISTKTWVGIIILSVIIIVLITWFTRKKWLSWIFLNRLNKSLRQEDFHLHETYTLLRRWLGTKGLVNNVNLTLREYAEKVDQKLNCSDMTTLTKYYEQRIYGNRDSFTHDQTKIMIECCENIIKKWDA
ncbi:transglutaminaseTgpA domain-containing protein [Terrilactibacillus laevilacticus]|uniref:transglutaminase family protein n=1 Tax=Terrilactibacillus laevilacticus TaxID=1380157 RepID=UPI0011469F3B|nr:transglutaminase domain-containing protein [Terrilactibacillus laevilacticus]